MCRKEKLEICIYRNQSSIIKSIFSYLEIKEAAITNWLERDRESSSCNRVCSEVALAYKLLHVQRRLKLSFDLLEVFPQKKIPCVDGWDEARVVMIPMIGFRHFWKRKERKGKGYRMWEPSLTRPRLIYPKHAPTRTKKD